MYCSCPHGCRCCGKKRHTHHYKHKLHIVLFAWIVFLSTVPGFGNEMWAVAYLTWSIVTRWGGLPWLSRDTDGSRGMCSDTEEPGPHQQSTFLLKNYLMHCNWGWLLFYSMTEWIFLSFFCARSLFLGTMVWWLWVKQWRRLSITYTT